MIKKLKKPLLTGGKIAIAAGLLLWVYRDMDWGEFGQTLAGADILLMLCAFGGYVISLVIIAFRLQLLLRTQEIEIRIWELIRLTFLGQFFNAVVPGVVGGDLVKAYYIAKHTHHKGVAVITVFVDRLMGITALVLLATAMLLGLGASGRGTWEEMKLPAMAAAVAMAAVMAMMVFLFSRRVRKLLRLQKIYGRLPIAQHIGAAGAAARRFRSRPGVLLKAIAITFAGQGSWILGIALIGASLSLEVAWHKYFVYVPLIYIIGAVPITPGGVGLVEKAYMLFFSSAAVSKEQIGALALIARALDIARGLPGLIVAISGAKLPKAEHLQAELDMDDQDEDEPVGDQRPAP